LPKGCGISNFGATKIFLELGSHINVDKEIERLTKKLNEQLGFIENLLKKINDKNRDKIPEKLKIEQNQQLEGYQME
jgi:valyl-tRNA synthetase